MTSVRFIEAVRYATLKHGTQKRKAANRMHVPYMVHPLEATQILVECDVIDEDVLIGCILHDVLEDCRANGACEADIRNKFGERVLQLVLTNTDDPNLDRAAQKEAQLIHAHEKSFYAAMIKAADKTSNMRDIVRVPPPWKPESIRGYVMHARAVVGNLNVNEKIRALFWQASQDALDLAAEMEAKNASSGQEASR